MLQFQTYIDISDQDVSRVLGDALRALSEKGVAASIDEADAVLTDTDLDGGDTPTHKVDVTKPIRIAHVIKGLNMAVKQHRPDIALGHAVLLPSENLLKSDGQAIALTDLEVRVLSYLARQDDQTATKDALLEHVWGYNPDVTSHTVETHIYRLRQKHAVIEGLIRTTDQGYMLYCNEGDNSGA